MLGDYSGCMSALDLTRTPAFARGAALFGEGQWWEAHEAWEGEWTAAAGHDRAFLQALILLAAALHKRWVHGSLTHRNFFKAQKYLDALPGVYAGVNLVRLRAEVWAALHEEGRRPQVVPGGDPPCASSGIL